MQRPSLTAKLLIVVLGLSFAFTAVCAVTGYITFKHAFVQAAQTDLALYAKERARGQDAAFRNLTLTNIAALKELERRLDLLSDAEVERRFERYFPLKPDGSRRTDPSLFKGLALSTGDYKYGMGGLIVHGAAVPLADKRLFVVVLDVVQAIGESRGKQLDNFNFFTPSGDVIAFAPERPDQMEDIRSGPANKVQLPQTDDSVAISAGAHPNTETRCVPAQRAAQFARACYTPAYVRGRYVGAFSTVLSQESYLPAVLKDRAPGVVNMIIDDKGVLIAAAGNLDDRRGMPSAARPHRERAQTPKSIIADIKASGATSGVIDRANTGRVAAFTRLTVPSLYLVVEGSRAPIERKAAWAAWAIVGAGLLALLGAGLMIFFYVRRLIVRPLERLARHSLKIRAAPGALLDENTAAEVSDLEARQDEIGDLANCLAEERARSETILQSLEDRVAKRTAELDRANRAKSSFLANMSHELRTPLNGVVALSDLLAQRQTSDETRKMAELVVSSAKLLEQVLTDILDVSKIEAGQMSLCNEPFDLGALVERIAQLHSAAALAKGVALTWTVSPAAAGRYLGDEVRMAQILSNLLSNAVKFTAEGQVSLTMDACEQGLKLTVEDTGIGFSEEMSERLFRRFEQADVSVTRRFGGTGLGLAICASLCELMGGSIAAASSVGHGARFTAILPLARASAQTAPQAAKAPLGEVLAGMRVLLAEDHPTNQKVVSLILAPLGAEIVTVENGAQAVEAFRTEAFDVVLMDLHMPVMDGLTAIGLIRADEAACSAKPVPIIALTADALAEHVHATRAAGADLHLSKPIHPAALIQAICEACGEGKDDPRSDGQARLALAP